MLLDWSVSKRRFEQMPKINRTYCTVYGCLVNNVKNPHHSFFSIPRNEAVRLRWLQLMGRMDIVDSYHYHRVCEEHFKPEYILLKSTRRMLKRNVLPTLKLPYTGADDEPPEEVQIKQELEIKQEIEDSFSEHEDDILEALEKRKRQNEDDLLGEASKKIKENRHTDEDSLETARELESKMAAVAWGAHTPRAALRRQSAVGTLAEGRLAVTMSALTQTQNSILRISDEKTLQLIELYEQNECLWNTHVPEYKSRERRQKATEKIARKLDIKYFEPRHVVIKFKNLRNSYCQELKKIASSVSLGLSQEEQYKPKVFWFSKMDSFLRPHLQPGRATNGAFSVQVDGERVKSEAGDSDSNQNSEDFCVKEDSVNSFPIVELDIDDSINSEDEPPMKRARYSSSSSRMISSFGQNNLEKTIKDLEAKIEELTEANKEDYYDSFGKYIASLLRSMPKERAMLLQPKVISLIVSGSGGGEGSVSQSDN
ncbi:uncharacterized protein LOC125231174 [Leguminivora glycinivorella]|uniref:uncharacterized protein LOC125231174 n=1 Tax=Leguminivora glycinivorella TaxID=1035111 RepID=UPI00200EC5E9|nr:uncharacterized protein LOC125231174 [Leguminivora glycinivorella]